MRLLRPRSVLARRIVALRRARGHKALPAARYPRGVKATREGAHSRLARQSSLSEFLRAQACAEISHLPLQSRSKRQEVAKNVRLLFRRFTDYLRRRAVDRSKAAFPPAAALQSRQ